MRHGENKNKKVEVQGVLIQCSPSGQPNLSSGYVQILYLWKENLFVIIFLNFHEILLTYFELKLHFLNRTFPLSRFLYPRKWTQFGKPEVEIRCIDRMLWKFQSITLNKFPFQRYKICTYLPDRFAWPGLDYGTETLCISTFFLFSPCLICYIVSRMLSILLKWNSIHL